MRIKIASVLVNDQRKALKFYTEVLGFVVKHDIPMGEFSWLTVVSAEAPDDFELLLEPNENPIGSAFQKGLFEQGIPATMFFSKDIENEYRRLKSLGVVFKVELTQNEWGRSAIFEDTCGNYISLQEG